MRRCLAVLGMLVFVGLLPSWAAGQGLGDAAARERSKRAKAKPPSAEAATYTDDDLEAGRPPGAKKESGSRGPGAAPVEGRGSSSSEGSQATAREPGERQPGPRVQEAEERVRAAEARVAELRDKLNPMSGSFIYGPTGSQSPNEEAQVRAELNEADRALADARAHLAAAKAEGETAGSTETAAPVPR